MRDYYEYEDWRGCVRRPSGPPLVAGAARSGPHAHWTLDDMLDPALHALPGESLDLVVDLRVQRPSMDFLTWLANADVYRQVHGFDGVRVRFEHMKGLVDRERGFFIHVVRPALALFPDMTEGHDTEVPTQCFSQTIKFAVEVFRRKRLAPRLHSPIRHSKIADFATVTLRETDYMTSRNSNLSAWVAFAKTLDRRTIFVRDTAKANEPIKGFETSPLASENLHYRMALYERASMNYFVANGPAALALYTRHVPYICLMKSPTDYSVNQSPNIKDAFSIERGEQFPWATNRQRLVWSDDSLEEIMAAVPATPVRSAAHG